MALAIEDYALISDCYTGALVGRDGSIDWLCLPRYDSPSIFGSLLGTPDHGRWLVAPTDPDARVERHYRGESFILQTTWTTSTGVVEVVDVMPRNDDRADVVRRIRGVSGHVEMRVELRMRFGYATSVPWVQQMHDAKHTLQAVAGPDALVVRGVELTPTDHVHEGIFTVREGEVVDHSLTWYPSHQAVPEPITAASGIRTTEKLWNDWASTFRHRGGYSDEVLRSLLVLRALTNTDTGGVAAAATTSLPEQFGGTRNWDYRYVWLRDASQTLSALIAHGYVEEVSSWRSWLLRALAGDPADVQIMYGLGGERFLPEYELDSLPGYHGASPVRIGNGAAKQFQADVIGEVMIALHDARLAGIEENAFSWSLQRALMGRLDEVAHKRDQGIWEIRGPARSFTHSRVMVWAAYDRAVRASEEFGLEGPVQHWRDQRAALRDEIERHGYDRRRNTFTQHYETAEVDAALLQLSQVGFVAPDDPRMLGTVQAIEEDLMQHGLLLRYRSTEQLDGLPAGEHPFLACSFWLVEQYARAGQLDAANTLMHKLCGLANDVGMLSEEYSPASGRQAGNTPQALSHLALVRAADAIARAEGHGDAIVGGGSPSRRIGEPD
ncbi:glycoside hydrolase family 15 protein [Humibacter ginsenosidimutans]|uniref:Glycoside hydrolase family 15 protein n=1 Tax=Humibacter ginsenosidimutans TaxID=2599293 RepID=A0A5B8M3D1_9MICO|nr:glycoside hydrolase family 15 protein [Humibacter ginsenosidimutans]QDZ14232.1 glycoside hydrolase family 15 protein [Humibacter ginsenosidimutans]